MIRDLYESLHGNVLSAVRECVDFIRDYGMSSRCYRDIHSRFMSLADIIKDYESDFE